MVYGLLRMSEDQPWNLIFLANPLLSTLFVLRLFFFFQAEDGIRDLTVTGVQTCALPISGKRHRRSVEPDVARRRSRLSDHVRELELLAAAASREARRHDDDGSALHDARRSEERRVGKECRSRWSAYD